LSNAILFYSFTRFKKRFLKLSSVDFIVLGFGGYTQMFSKSPKLVGLGFFMSVCEVIRMTTGGHCPHQYLAPQKFRVAIYNIFARS